MESRKPSTRRASRPLIMEKRPQLERKAKTEGKRKSDALLKNDLIAEYLNLDLFLQLREEIANDIEQNKRSPLYVHAKLKRMRKQFGSQRKAFLGFLEEALSRRKHGLANHILETYIDSFEPRDDELLFQMTFSQERNRKEDTRLLRLSTIVAFMKKMDMSLMSFERRKQFVDSIVENIYPDHYWFELPYDPFLKFVFHLFAKQVPLYQIDLSDSLSAALREGKNEMAVELLRSWASVAKVRLSECRFTEGSAKAFQFLYYAGYRFAEVDRMRTEISVCRSYRFEFDQFCEWLRSEERKVWPLSSLAWVSLRNSGDIKRREAFKKRVELSVDFNVQLKWFIQMDNFGLLHQK